MPTIPVYLPDRIYFLLTMEAEKYQVNPGKMAQLIIATYFKAKTKEGVIGEETKL